MTNEVKIQAGFYGWAPDGDGRRAARVLSDQSDGRLLVKLEGISGAQYEIPVETFTPDPEALYWEGHCPDPEEHAAELAKLRIFMSGDRDLEGEVQR
ncbi:MAG: hypothetical protein WCC22_07545 [Terriglobales bacterium]